MRPSNPPPRPTSRALLPAHIGRVAALLIASQGYASVTMEQVASQARVSKRTLYKYFPAKEALLEHLLEAALAADLSRRNLHAHERSGFRAGITALLHDSARWCEQHADVLLPYIRYKFATFDPSASTEQDRGLLPVLTGLIGSAQRQGELASTRRPGQLAIYFHYLYLGALMRWLSEPNIELRAEFDTVVELFIDGTAPRGGFSGSRAGSGRRRRPPAAPS